MKGFALVIGSASKMGTIVSQFLLLNDYTVIGADELDTNIDHKDFIDVYVDVSVEKSVEEMYQAIRANTKNLSLVVYADEFCQYAPLDEVSTKEFTQHYEKNLLGPFHVLKHLPSFFIANQTHVIMISTEGQEDFENTIFASTKTALNVLLEKASLEYQFIGVRFSKILSPNLNDESGRGISSDDFLHLFQMIISAPPYMEFPTIVLSRIDGFVSSATTLDDDDEYEDEKYDDDDFEDEFDDVDQEDEKG